MIDPSLERIYNHRLIPAPGEYEFDPVHTFVTFRAQHLVVGHVRGRFEAVSGSVTIADDPTGSRCQVSIETASITTQHSGRDNDLRSARFLDVAKFPLITYRSTSVTEMPEGRWLVHGELTIRDVTQSVALKVTGSGAIAGASKKARVAFHAVGRITRTDFGLTTELLTEDGGLLVGRDLLIDIDAEAVRPI